jgi:hypothetical protein
LMKGGVPRNVEGIADDGERDNDTHTPPECKEKKKKRKKKRGKKKKKKKREKKKREKKKGGHEAKSPVHDPPVSSATKRLHHGREASKESLRQKDTTTHRA